MTNSPEPIVHGIPNCDSVKRARQWFAEHDVGYRFHDFKKLGVPLDALAAWAAAVGWDRLINRQGSTWRKLSDAEKTGLASPTPAALAFVQERTSLIKRPLIQWPGGELTVGMDESVLARLSGR